MSIEVIPLSRLEADPRGTLTECLDSGRALVVELPDHRLVSIRSLEPGDDDDLVDHLLATNPSFRALVERSKASARKTFPAQLEDWGDLEEFPGPRLPPDRRVGQVVTKLLA